MKPKKLLLTALTVLCMMTILCTSALAVDLDDPRFYNKSWEDVLADFLAERSIDPSQVTVGYYNTVTGEEYYHNPDTLMYGASVAKLPTNMLYAERVSKGEMTMDTVIRGNRYEMLQRLSLVNSDNPAMETMVKDLGHGSYAEFRKQILPYIGETEETVDESFLARNFFTPTQILYTLKLLYGNADTYPGVEECLLKASPRDYFKGNQPPYTIAHKYGWYTDRGIRYLNDSAIIYTDDPILLVMFTADVEDARTKKDGRFVLADFCSLMCDYAQYHRVLRYSNEVYELTDLTLPTTLEFLGNDNPSKPTEGYAKWQFGFLGAGCVMLIAALILIFKKKLLALVSLLLAALLIVIGGGPTELAHLSVEQGYAQQVVENFTKAFHSNTRGIELLDDCDSAMAHSEGDDITSRITEQIDSSFDLTVNKAVRTENNIVVSVTATKTDIPAVAEALQTRWEAAFDAAIAASDPAVLYNEDGSFNPELSDSVTEQVIAELLESWDSYLVTEDAELHLTLTLDGFTPAWKIVCTEELLNLVNYE